VAGLVSRAKIFSNREATLSQCSIHIHHTVFEKHFSTHEKWALILCVPTKSTNKLQQVLYTIFKIQLHTHKRLRSRLSNSGSVYTTLFAQVRRATWSGADENYL